MLSQLTLFETHVYSSVIKFKPLHDFSKRNEEREEKKHFVLSAGCVSQEGRCEIAIK